MRYDERGERERDTIEQECGLGRYRSGGWGDGGRVKQENILNTDLPMHRKTPTPSGVILSMKSENEKRNRVSVKYGPDQEITVRKVTGHHRLPMARTITPRNAVLQYTQVARATPSLTPRTQFSCRSRRPAALTFTSTGPHSMSNA